MSRDPIIDEVRAVRDRIARETDYDLAAIFAMLRARERASAEHHVSPSEKPPALRVQEQPPTGELE